MENLILACKHQNADSKKQVCFHLLETKDKDYVKCFSGVGQSYHLLCLECARAFSEDTENIRFVCDQCFDEIQETDYWNGIIGQPEIFKRKTSLSFNHKTIELPFNSKHLLAIAPRSETSENLWIALDKSGKLLQIDLTHYIIGSIADISKTVIDLNSPISIKISSSGQFASIVNRFGQYGLVLNLSTGAVSMQLNRYDYHIDVTPFSVVFFTHDQQDYLVHATDWNRLDISDPETGVLLTSRSPTSYTSSEQRPPHYLDYFHGNLLVSPNQKWIVDDGWVWHPVGAVVTWNLTQWFKKNLWESEDGESKKTLCWRDYFWSGPLCWIDDHTLAVWGYGNDDEWLIPAVRIFNAETGHEIRWFAGPNVEQESNKPWFMKPENALIYDSFLYSLSEKSGTSIWDIFTGELLYQDDTFCPTHYHFGSKQFLTLRNESPVLLSILRDEGLPQN